MKKVFFQAVLVSTVIVGGILAYSIWKAAPMTAQALFNSGKKYYDQRKYPEAVIQFMNAIRKDPRHRDARYLLALSMVSQQDFNHAAGQLKALLEYYPDDPDASLQLGAIYMTGGRLNPDLFQQAQELAAHVLAKDPKNVNALILSGNAYVGFEDYRTAASLFEKAATLDPKSLPAFINLGTSQALLKNFREAEQAFLMARQIDPKDRSAMMFLANFYQTIKDSNRAEAVYREALSIYPSDKEVYLPAVIFYDQLGRMDEEERILHDAQNKDARIPEPLLILADLYTGRDRSADARKLLLELKQRFPTNMDVSIKLALSLLQDQPQQARKEIDQILKADPKNPVGQVLLGELQFLSGQFDAAETTLASSPAVDSQYPQVHFLLGNISARKSQLDQAIFHYQKSLAVNSTYIPARVALADVFQSQGRLSESRDALRQAMEVQPDYLPARILKATLDGNDKNNKEGEQELAALLKDQPQNAAVYRQMGRYYDSRGRTPDAEKNFLRALDLQPESQEILRELVFFYVRLKQTDRAIQKLNAIPDDKKLAFHYELLGLVYSQSGRSQDAENAYKKALEKDPNRTSSDAYLFADYMKNGRTTEGLQKLDDIIKKSPLNANAYGAKAQIYETQGNFEQAKVNYTQALKVDPNAEIAANNLAYILAEQGSDLNAALGWAQVARKKRPDNPDIADTLGWVYYKLGNYVLAREQVKFAVSKQPDNGSYQYHLGMIYEKTSQMTEAQAALKKAIGSRTDFKERSLAEAALKDVSR